MRILVIEDEEIMQNILAKGFTKLGYLVDSAFDGKEAIDMYFENAYDLIILDLNLPKIDGMDVLKEIRTENKTIPIIILSARSTLLDKIDGLDEGANDFLTKPFHFEELEARVRALLRRNFKTVDKIINLDLVQIDTATKKVSTKKEEEITLSRIEYAILEYLAVRKGQMVSSSELIDKIWKQDHDNTINTFKVRLNSLRKKLPDGVIKNSRGHGYYVE
jgi:DNA-binding response OmpR family regulator